MKNTKYKIQNTRYAQRGFTPGTITSIHACAFGGLFSSVKHKTKKYFSNFNRSKTNARLVRGFTLIETMIAVALFTVIVTIGIGAVLNSNNSYKKSQTVRSVLDNLSFIMEDMSRNIRLGSDYHCGNISNIETPQDCASPSLTFALEGQNGVSRNTADQFVYGITTDDGVNYKIIKSIDSVVTSKTLTPSEVSIDPAASGFTVIGSAPFPDTTQPRVIIRLSGTVTYKDLVSKFNIETTVSQRLIDL